MKQKSPSPSACPRVPAHPIEPIFVQRWSPRAFDGAPMPERHMLLLLEAARWAPSAYNLQPWRFLYAHRNDQHFSTFLGLLVPFNATWAKRASALVFLLSQKQTQRDGQLIAVTSHRFDAGAAWAQFALQATGLGYQAHAMGGIDYECARTVLRVPEDFEVQIGIAVGRGADPTVLPLELRSREGKSSRRSTEEFAVRGIFEPFLNS